MSGEPAVPPPVLWAQRKDNILLTFNIESKDPTINIEKESVYFRGLRTLDNRVHEVTIPLYGEVLPDKSGFVNKGRMIEVVLRKAKPTDPYWPTLTKDTKKLHYLKIDFNKWEDEEEDNQDVDNPLSAGSLEDALRSLGTSKKPEIDLESDSDDENLPDLE